MLLQTFRSFINLEEHNLLHPSHHGFRKGHNTSTALLEMSNVWHEALDDKDITATIMLDLSAAFDVVDSSILLDKIKIDGFEENSVQWLSSYLTSRSQQVYVDGALSEPLPVELGVPPRIHPRPIIIHNLYRFI